MDIQEMIITIAWEAKKGEEMFESRIYAELYAWIW